MGRAGAPLQTTAGAFLFLPAEQRRDPGLGGDFVPVRQQPVQIERRGPGTLCVWFIPIRIKKDSRGDSQDRRSVIDS